MHCVPRTKSTAAHTNIVHVRVHYLLLLFQHDLVFLENHSTGMGGGSEYTYTFITDRHAMITSLCCRRDSSSWDHMYRKIYFKWYSPIVITNDCGHAIGVLTFCWVWDSACSTWESEVSSCFIFSSCSFLCSSSCTSASLLFTSRSSSSLILCSDLEIRHNQLFYQITLRTANTQTHTRVHVRTHTHTHTHRVTD